MPVYRVIQLQAALPAWIGLFHRELTALSSNWAPMTGFAVLIPAFKETGARLRSVASSAGVSGVHAGKKFGFEETTTESKRIIDDDQTDAIVVTTRHDTHAALALDALAKGKHVFVEKPLCLTLPEAQQIEDAHRASASSPVLMVGFNRRFSPLVAKAKSLLEPMREPKAMVMTVNAGAIPADHWTQDLSVGGGRIIGEACHFVDLLRDTGMPDDRLRAITHDNIERAFGLTIPEHRRVPNPDLAGEYPYDPFAGRGGKELPR